MADWVKPSPGRPASSGPKARSRAATSRWCRSTGSTAACTPRTSTCSRPRNGRRRWRRWRRRGSGSASSSGRRWPSCSRARRGARRSTCRARSTTVFVEPISGRRGRRGRKWFSFDLPVDPARPMALVVTYHADQPRERRFEILVDGTRVGEQALPGERRLALPRRGVPAARVPVEGKRNHRALPGRRARRSPLSSASAWSAPSRRGDRPFDRSPGSCSIHALTAPRCRSSPTPFV